MLAAVLPSTCWWIPRCDTDSAAIVVGAGGGRAYFMRNRMGALIQFGRLKADEWLLVAGASSGVGVASLQLGRSSRKVIGVSGSAEKLEKLRELGLDIGNSRARRGFQRPGSGATADKGADLAVNLVGGTALLRARNRSVILGVWRS